MTTITNINQMKQSKYLKKEDVGQGMLLTIKGFTQENVAGDNDEPDEKYVLHFDEDVKACVINWTNIQLCAKATGSDNPNEWTGKKIVLYHDPNVSFGGKLMGGIRIRAPRNQPAVQQTNAEFQQAAAGPAPTGHDFDDDVGF